MRLTTIGYEGFKPETFFQVLKTNEVQTIVDIRELPLSHKPGFSKTALASGAAAHSLHYVHIRALGCPRKIRHDYRENKDWALYTRRFRAYLSAQAGEIERLAEMVRTESCCLLCFEADHLHCHRRYVVDALFEILGEELSIKYLGQTG